LAAAARIGSSTNPFNRARTIGGTRGASARHPFELDVGDDGVSRPLLDGFEPVDEPRVEAALEFFESDLAWREHHHDVDQCGAPTSVVDE